MPFNEVNVVHSTLTTYMLFIECFSKLPFPKTKNPFSAPASVAFNAYSQPAALIVLLPARCRVQREPTAGHKLPVRQRVTLHFLAAVFVSNVYHDEQEPSERKQ